MPCNTEHLPVGKIKIHAMEDECRVQDKLKEKREKMVHGWGRQKAEHRKVKR